jgi:hypothetical protein
MAAEHASGKTASEESEQTVKRILRRQPGPWTYDPNDFGISGGCIRDAEGYEVCRTISDNAPLIAASHELLKVAIAAAHFSASYLAAPGCQGEDLAREILEAAKASIEKAGLSWP